MSPAPAPRRRPLLVALAALAALGVALGLTGPASAGTSTTAPVRVTMEGPGDGLVLTGDDGPENDSILLAEDHLGQPILSLLEAGGLAVTGDNFRVLDPGLNPVLTYSWTAPDPASCGKAGNMWHGPMHIWRCADLDGAGPSPLAWWVAL